jgi:hypothetical protein
MKERLVGMLASPSPTRSAAAVADDTAAPDRLLERLVDVPTLQGRHRGLGVDSRKRLPLIVVPPSEPTA